jgi:hypothetical protein
MPRSRCALASEGVRVMLRGRVKPARERDQFKRTHEQAPCGAMRASRITYAREQLVLQLLQNLLTSTHLLVSLFVS